MSDTAISPPVYARLLGVSVHGILELIASGTLPAIDVRRPGSSKPRWKILPEHRAAFEAARSATPTTKAARHKRAKQKGYTDYFG